MKRNTFISKDYFTAFPNEAFIQIRKLIKNKKLIEIDISVYFVALNQFYKIKTIRERKSEEEHSVSLTINRVANELGISDSHASKRITALANCGLLKRESVDHSVSGNKNTEPTIFWDAKKKKLVSNFHYIARDDENNQTKPVSNTAEDDVPV